MKLTNLLFEQIKKDPKHIEVLATPFGKVYGLKFDGQQVDVVQGLDFIRVASGKQLPTRNLDQSRDFPIIKNVLEDQGIEIEITIGGSQKSTIAEAPQFAVPQLYNELRKHITLTAQPSGASDFDRTFPSLKSFADFISQKNIQITTDTLAEESSDNKKLIAVYNNYGDFYKLELGGKELGSHKEAADFVQKVTGMELPKTAMYTDPVFGKLEDAFSQKGYNFSVFEIDVD